MEASECRHPDHVAGTDCRDRAVGCDAECPCCIEQPGPPCPECEWPLWYGRCFTVDCSRYCNEDPEKFGPLTYDF